MDRGVCRMRDDWIKDEDRFREDIFKKKQYGPNSPEWVIIDVGAHVGIYAEYMRKVAKKIYCIEPSLVNFDELQHRIYENEWANVECFNFAIAAEDGERSLYSGKSDGAYSTFQGNGITNYEHNVIAKTLKTFMAEQGIEHVDILKVDCECCENEIFNAGYKEIAPMIDKVVGEIHIGDQRSLECLKENGYGIKMTDTNTYIATK